MKVRKSLWVTQITLPTMPGHPEGATAYLVHHDKTVVKDSVALFRVQYAGIALAFTELRYIRDRGFKPRTRRTRKPKQEEQSCPASPEGSPQSTPH